MTLATLLLTALLCILLLPAAFVHLLYAAGMRLRSRDAESLTWFRDYLEPKLGLRLDQGAFVFSVVKHTLLLMAGFSVLMFTTHGQPLNWRAVGEAAAISWVLMVTFAHILPHLALTKTSGRWLLPTLPLLALCATLTRPLMGAMTFLQSLAELNEPEETKEDSATPAEEIEALIEAGTEEGIIAEEDHQLIRSVVEFGDKTVREVMTPRPNIVAIEVDSTIEELRQLIIREQYSRIPVYQSTIDRVAGFVHVRDVFEVEYGDRSTRHVRDVMRKIRFVPETKPVGDLLREMQREGSHMVMVIDEYGNTAGLSTMEDLVEEILGEIRDEYEPDADVTGDAQSGFVMSGNLDLDRLADLLDFRAPGETESTTIGGLITEWLGHVPKAHETVEREGLLIEVLASDERRVSQVRLRRIEPQPPGDAAPREGDRNGQTAQA
ncbi:MAG: HlyC/CorC family transporter [Acidobacteria bacterium]|nr:HlyC/CorC family transporter [Acidobacteriota bacterium]